MPRKLTQHELARDSDVARSTIAKYCQGLSANPDLDTVCRLASTLNVSPALLLMTPKDWEILAHTYLTIESVVNDDEARKLVKLHSSSRNVRSKATIDFVRRVNGHDAVENYLTESNYEKIMRGIFSTCELPDLKALKGDSDLIILTMCVVLGSRLIDKRGKK